MLLRRLHPSLDQVNMVHLQWLRSSLLLPCHPRRNSSFLQVRHLNKLVLVLPQVGHSKQCDQVVGRLSHQRQLLRANIVSSLIALFRTLN
jgi:hypothetical protein